MSRKKRMARRARHRGAFRRYTLYYLLALFLLLAVALMLCMTVFFRVESISVTGCTLYSEDEVIATGGISRGDNLLRLHCSEIAGRVREKYPYFETVSVRRVLPDGVKIIVTEASEYAALRGQDGTYTVLSRSGRALRCGVAACPAGLIPADGFNLVSDVKSKGGDTTVPLVAGAQLTESENERYEALKELLDALEDSSLTGKVNVIDLSDVLDIRLLFDGRLAIYVGGGTDLDYKLRFAALAIEKDVTDETVGTLDVSQKPTARLRETDIYIEDTWPFADDLLAEYERKIVRDTPWLTEESETSANGEESAADETAAETTYTAPAESEDDSSADESGQEYAQTESALADESYPDEGDEYIDDDDKEDED